MLKTAIIVSRSANGGSGRGSLHGGRQRRSRGTIHANFSSQINQSMPTIKIFVGTMYGGALDVAEQVKPLFEDAGYDVAIFEQPTLDDLLESPAELVLFCVSTTGSGDFPGNFVPIARAIAECHPPLTELRYGLIALGDSSYGDTFCGAGRSLDALLEEHGAQRLGERLEVDAMETFMADDAALPWVETWIDEQQLRRD